MIPWSASSGATRKTPTTASVVRTAARLPVMARRLPATASIIEDGLVRRVGHQAEEYRIGSEEQAVTAVLGEVVRTACDGASGPCGGDHEGHQRGQEEHRQDQLAGAREGGQRGDERPQDPDPEVREEADQEHPAQVAGEG